MIAGSCFSQASGVHHDLAVREPCARDQGLSRFPAGSLDCGPVADDGNSLRDQSKREASRAAKAGDRRRRRRSALDLGFELVIVARDHAAEDAELPSAGWWPAPRCKRPAATGRTPRRPSTPLDGASDIEAGALATMTTSGRKRTILRANSFARSCSCHHRRI